MLKRGQGNLALIIINMVSPCTRNNETLLWLIRQTSNLRNASCIGSNPSGARHSLRKTLYTLLSTGWFKEMIKVCLQANGFPHNRSKIHSV